ncbi:MAG TPA: hypothetical protein VMS88_06395, partial [Terriglobales bacterium]|nr:hypothetical protein [Terriglobales bacterium]
MVQRFVLARFLLPSLIALAGFGFIVPKSAALAAPVRPLSAEAQRFLGDWYGALPVGGARVQIIFRIIRGQLGGMVGTMDIPEQHASGIGMDSLLIGRGTIR